MEADSPSTTSLPAYRIFRDKHGIPQFEPKRGTQALKDALIYAFPSLETELQLMQAALRKFFDSERGSKFVFELPQNDLQTSLAKPKNVEGEVSPIQFGKASLKSWKGNVGGRRGSRASSRASSRPPSRPPSRALSRVSSRTETRTETPITRPGTPLDLNSGGKMTTWILSNGQEVEGRKKQPYDPVKRRKVAENRGNACDKHRASKTTCDPEVCPQNKGYWKAADEVSNTTADMTGGPRGLPTVKEVRKSENKLVNTAPDATSENIPTENALFQDKADLFWEASEYQDVSFDTADSLLSFGNSSIDSEALSWADTSNASGYSIHSLPAHASNREINLHTNGFATDVGTGNTMETGALEEFRTERLSQVFSVPLDISSQLQPQDLLRKKEKPSQCSEDPFMGWAIKRTSQMCEDYGWVLSHVETL